jgi:hypothetical protein
MSCISRRGTKLLATACPLTNGRRGWSACRLPIRPSERSLARLPDLRLHNRRGLPNEVDQVLGCRRCGNCCRRRRRTRRDVVAIMKARRRRETPNQLQGACGVFWPLGADWMAVSATPVRLVRLTVA